MEKMIEPFDFVFHGITYRIFQNMELVRIVDDQVDYPAVRFSDMGVMFRISAESAVGI